MLFLFNKLCIFSPIEIFFLLPLFFLCFFSNAFNNSISCSLLSTLYINENNKKKLFELINTNNNNININNKKIKYNSIKKHFTKNNPLNNINNLTNINYTQTQRTYLHQIKKKIKSKK